MMGMGATLGALTGALRADAAAQVQTKGEPFWAARCPAQLEWESPFLLIVMLTGRRRNIPNC